VLQKGYAVHCSDRTIHTGDTYDGLLCGNRRQGIQLQSTLLFSVLYLFNEIFWINLGKPCRGGDYVIV
jgi:hypothetical protein